MSTEYVKITSIEQLKTFLAKAPDVCHDFVLMLKGGLRSSKTLAYDEIDDKIEINHLIDESEKYLTFDELKKGETNNIMEGIKKGAFYYENYKVAV